MYWFFLASSPTDRGTFARFKLGGVEFLTPSSSTDWSKRRLPGGSCAAAYAAAYPAAIAESALQNPLKSILLGSQGRRQAQSIC